MVVAWARPGADCAAGLFRSRPRSSSRPAPAAPRHWRPVRAVQQHQQHDLQPSALDASRALAAARAAEAQQASPVVADPFAAALVPKGAGGAEQAAGAGAALDAVVARFLDEQLLKAVSLVNMERKEGYNQVVIVGDAMDTRPFRLPWPEGTVIYLVGAAEVHEAAEAALREAGARVPRGCLLRRVSADLRSGGPEASFSPALERAGFRGDRLSVWGLQGANSFGLTAANVGAIFTDASNLAAFDSLVLGELPAMERSEVENLMAAYGLLGAALELQSQPGGERLVPAPAGEPSPWLFIAHQKRLSLQQMGIYSEFVAEYEEMSEDFEGDFS